MWSAVLSGPREQWIGELDAVDFYDIKGTVELLIEMYLDSGSQASLAQHARPISTPLDESLAKKAPYLHPARAARLQVGGHDVGFLGEVHPDIASHFDLAHRTVLATMDIARLRQAVAPLGMVTGPYELPRFPAVFRDIAVVVDESVQAEQVRDVALRVSGGMAVEVRIMDVYRGPPVPPGKKSLAFRVAYRVPNRTLRDDEVDSTHDTITEALGTKLKASVRI